MLVFVFLSNIPIIFSTQFELIDESYDKRGHVKNMANKFEPKQMNRTLYNREDVIAMPLKKNSDLTSNCLSNMASARNESRPFIRSTDDQKEITFTFSDTSETSFLHRAMHQSNNLHLDKHSEVISQQPKRSNFQFEVRKQELHNYLGRNCQTSESPYRQNLIIQIPKDATDKNNCESKPPRKGSKQKSISLIAQVEDLNDPDRRVPKYRSKKQTRSELNVKHSRLIEQQSETSTDDELEIARTIKKTSVKPKRKIMNAKSKPLSPPVK